VTPALKPRTAASTHVLQRGGGIPKYYSIKTVAEAIDVSTRTVRRWIASGDLVVHRVDGVVRVAEADLRAFLAQHREA
jgi:excisionase family DNA binding protein